MGRAELRRRGRLRRLVLRRQAGAGRDDAPARRARRADRQRRQRLAAASCSPRPSEVAGRAGRLCRRRRADPLVPRRRADRRDDACSDRSRRSSARAIPLFAGARASATSSSSIASSRRSDGLVQLPLPASAASGATPGRGRDRLGSSAHAPGPHRDRATSRGRARVRHLLAAAQRADHLPRRSPSTTRSPT